MTRDDKRSRPSIGIRLSIWSVRNQSWLAGQVRIYIFFGTALIAFLALAGVISIETAMFSALCGGLVLMGLIWTFIQQRRAILLNIEAPEVREQAHRAMLTYLREVDPDTFTHTDTPSFTGEPRKGCSGCSPP
jgi:Flp pilus assembly protein TadB